MVSRYPWATSWEESGVSHLGQYGQDVVPLLEEPAIVERAQRPPDALDVRGGHREVGVGVVEPVSQPVAHRLPDGGDLERARPARFAEPCDPVLLDLLLRPEPEPFLDLELDREAVAVPTGHRAHDPEPAHPAVAQVDVLERAGEQVTHVGVPVRCGGALGETEDRTVGTPGDRSGRYPGRFPVFPGCAAGSPIAMGPAPPLLPRSARLPARRSPSR